MIQSGNEAVTKYEIRDTDAVKSELTVEAAAAPEKEADPVADHSTVTILEKAKTGAGGASLGPIRPVVVKTPGVRGALDEAARHRKKRHHPTTPEFSAGPSGTFYPRHYNMAPGFFPTGIDHAYLHKSLPPPSRPYIRKPISPSPHITGTPSGRESIKEPKRLRSFWNYNIVKTFLDACIHEIAINGCEGGSLKAMSWKKVGEMLKASHSFSVDSKQMKTYFDGLKSKYKAWVLLKNKTGNKYDPSTNMFNLTDMEWETEIKKNKCIVELRKTPLRFPDLCSQLFDGGIDQTLTEPGPSHPTLPPPHVAASPSGKASLEPQAAVVLVPPLAPPLPATETPAESQKEAIVELPQEVPEKEVAPPPAAETTIPKKKRPRWPGDCVFRVIVPVHKVESITGRNEVLIKKIREDTKANIRILEGPVCDPYLTVEVSGKEDIEAPLSPAMDAVIRVFKCVNGFPENESDGVASIPLCSIRLLLTSMQAMSLIGKQESPIKTIQENTGCYVRFLSYDEVSTLSTNSDDRVVELQGEPLQVLQALKAVHRHLHMFLVDHSIPPLFDSNMVEVTMQMEAKEPAIWSGSSRAFSGSRKAFHRTDRDFFGPAFWNTSIFYPLYPPPPFHRCNKHCHCRRRPMSPPSDVTAAPSGMESIKEPKRIRYLWKDNIVKTFLDACIHEIAINGLEGGSLKAMSWKNVGEMLKDRHNFFVDSKQMKNYFDGLKSKYRAWVLLKSKTGNQYDPSTNMFNLTDTEWETEIKKNKCIEELRNAPLRFPDLCAQLFDGGVDQTLTEPGQSCQPHVAASPSGEATLEPQATVALASPSGVTLPPSPATETPQKEPMVEVPPQLPKGQPARELVAIETKRSMSEFEKEILGVLKMIADKMSIPEPPSKPTIEDCEKKLNELGWPKDDPLHLVALTIFRDKNDNYRKLWMKLNQNLCANWVRMVGRSKRFT